MDTTPDVLLPGTLAPQARPDNAFNRVVFPPQLGAQIAVNFPLENFPDTEVRALTFVFDEHHDAPVFGNVKLKSVNSKLVISRFVLNTVLVL
jgi:hypothetical protein